MLPERYAELVQHDKRIYTQWEKLYYCVFSSEANMLEENEKPTTDCPAIVPLTPLVPFDEGDCDHTWHHMTSVRDWDKACPVPVPSFSFSPSCLNRTRPPVLPAEVLVPLNWMQ